MLTSIEPAIHFILRLDLTDHRHPDNLAAESAKVCELLRQTMQALGSDHRQRKGEIKTPTWDAGRCTGGHTVIGS